MKSLVNDIQEILIPKETIEEKVKELALQITKDYKGKDPILISILKGSVVFLADLVRNLDVRCSIDFIALSSYSRTESSGIVRLIMDLRESIEGRNVLLIEDIVDTGLTMAYLKNNLFTRKPKSFKLCTFLSKPSNREIDIDIDYLGFEIPNKFVVGYGLDFMEEYRNLPYVAILKPEIYRK